MTVYKSQNKQANKKPQKATEKLTLNVLIFQHVYGRFTTKRVEKWSKEFFIFKTDDCKGS